MSKELGEKISGTLKYKIAHNLFISKHGLERLKERKSELVGNDITETIGKLHTEIIGCLYGYNANDGSIHIVLSGGYEIIVEYNDNRKKWTFITIKAPSENGYYPSEKMAMSKMRVKKHKTKMCNYMNENEHSQRHDNKTRKAKPYKREKFNWREY